MFTKSNLKKPKDHAAALSNFTVATIQGMTQDLVVIPNGAVPTTDRFGRADRAYLFDGIDDFLEIPSNPMYAGSRFTVIVTFQIFMAPTDVIYQSAQGFSSRDMQLLQNSDYYLKISQFSTVGYPFFHYVHNTGTTSDGASCETAPIQINQYYQVAASYGDGTIRLAVNGITHVDKTILPMVAPGTAPIIVGRNYGIDPAFFNGVIDEVRLFDWPLTAAELSAQYQAVTS